MSMMVPVYGTDGKASVQQIFLLVAAFLTDMAQLPIISGPEPHKMVQIILYAIFFLIELPLFIAFENTERRRCRRQVSLWRPCDMNLKIIISPQGTLAIYEQIVSQLKMP